MFGQTSQFPGAEEPAHVPLESCGRAWGRRGHGACFTAGLSHGTALCFRRTGRLSGQELRQASVYLRAQQPRFVVCRAW